jgi:nitrite reductase/ring-hydroxylating ferredoxin subunit
MSWQQGLIEAVERQAWLDKVGDYVMELAKPLLNAPQAPRVMDFLHGRWLGHSLHPALSDLPLGFWTGSLLLDLVGASKSAGVLSAAGSATAVATAASGLADWTHTYGSERRVGMLHGLANSAGLGLQVLSLGARLRRRRLKALGYSFLGWSLSVGAAYLGGELIYGKGVAVNHDAWRTGPENWTPVAGTEELVEGAPRAVEVEGRKVLLYRENGRVYAIEETCTHAGGPLSEGEVRDGVVTCPWHGSQFRLKDGEALHGPATFGQPRLQTRVRGGRIEVKGRPA